MMTAIRATAETKKILSRVVPIVVAVIRSVRAASGGVAVMTKQRLLLVVERGGETKRTPTTLRLPRRSAKNVKNGPGRVVAVLQPILGGLLTDLAVCVSEPAAERTGP